MVGEERGTAAVYNQAIADLDVLLGFGDDMDAFARNFGSLLDAVDDCLANGRQLPALLLIYTGIDIVASLEARRGESTSQSFTGWVGDYMTGAQPLPCTPLELYAARCGMVHTLTAESDLFRGGKVRKVFYAWGAGDAAALQETIDVMGERAVAVHIPLLADTFRRGVVDYLTDLVADKRRLAVVTKASGMWFTDLKPEVIEALNAARWPSEP